MASGPCFDFPAPRAVGKNLRAFDHITERKPGQTALSTVHSFNRKKHFFFFNLLIYLNKTKNQFITTGIVLNITLKFLFSIKFLY